jgi:hypothetical protein
LQTTISRTKKPPVNITWVLKWGLKKEVKDLQLLGEVGDRIREVGDLSDRIWLNSVPFKFG